MRSIVVTVTAAAMFIVSAVEFADAMPMAAPGAAAPVQKQADVEQARVYCYSTATGRFLHWGYCGARRVHYRRPGRVYCKRISDGAFLHWGSCW